MPTGQMNSCISPPGSASPPASPKCWPTILPPQREYDAAGLRPALKPLSRVQQELLHPPVQQLGGVHLVFRGTGQLMNPAKLLELATSAAKPPQHLTVERHLIDASRKCIGDIENLMRGWRDADGPRGAWLIDGGRRGLKDWTRIGWHRDVDVEDVEHLPGGIQHLNAAVATVRDVETILRVDDHRVQRTELARTRTRLAEGPDPVAVAIVLGDPGVDVAIADVDVVVRVPGHIRYLTEQTVGGRQRRMGMRERMCAFVRCLGLATQHECDAPPGIEAHYQIGTLIGHPHVVIPIDAHGMREGPRVEVVTDLTQIMAV